MLPLLLIFLFGIIDVGRFMWEYNRGGKGDPDGRPLCRRDRSGCRPACRPTASRSATAIPQGTAVPIANFDSATCDEHRLQLHCTGGGLRSVDWL